MKELEGLYRKYDHFFITFRNPHTTNLKKTEKVYFVTNPQRLQALYNPFRFIISIVQSFIILLKEKPDFIVSTGAGVAVPVCYAAKILRKKIVFIELTSSVTKLGWSGRMIYPIADLFFVQYKKLAENYKKAIYVGNLHDFC